MSFRARHLVAAVIIAAVASIGASSPSRAGLVAVGVADSLSMHHDRVASVAAPGVLANDLNLVGGSTAILVSSTSHGSLALHSDGGYVYVPAAAYVGVDTFRYRPSGLLSTAATVTITITNSPPVASADAYSVRNDATLSVPPPGVLADDTDADSDSLTAQLVGGVSHGALTFTASGGLSYTPAGGYVGSDVFT
ncbi:MAG TPA: Ig-like domain-containing protein, partial [Candidatus Limnocylindrales bacterium]